MPTACQGLSRVWCSCYGSPSKSVLVAGVTPGTPPILSTSPGLTLKGDGLRAGGYPPSWDTTSSLVTESWSRSSLIFFSRLEYGCSSMPNLWMGARLQGGRSRQGRAGRMGRVGQGCGQADTQAQMPGQEAGRAWGGASWFVLWDPESPEAQPRQRAPPTPP